MPRLSLLRSTALVLTGLVTVAGCSGGEGGSADAADLLTAARTSLDRTTALHFTLTSVDVPAGGTRLMGGEGVVARPKSFQGKLSVQLNDSKVSIDLVSTDGTVYAKLPFSNDFQVTDPASFGLSDPANLIDARTGISRMFGELTGVADKGEQRIGNDVVTELDGSLPGSLVDDLLTSADPAVPVKTQLFVTTSTHQLRRVVLTGPFFEKGHDSTFNLVLDRYGAPVSITAPATP
jgi:lipoprotein LprG